MTTAAPAKFTHEKRVKSAHKPAPVAVIRISVAPEESTADLGLNFNSNVPLPFELEDDIISRARTAIETQLDRLEARSDVRLAIQIVLDLQPGWQPFKPQMARMVSQFVSNTLRRALRSKLHTGDVVAVDLDKVQLRNAGATATFYSTSVHGRVLKIDQKKGRALLRLPIRVGPQDEFWVELSRITRLGFKPK